MRSQSSRHAWILASLSLFVGSSGCGLILGLDEYTLVEGSGGSGGGATTSSGTAGGSGTGGKAGCTPNQMVACYSGPAGTEGVGQCKAGMALCSTDGTIGACMGESLPGTEDCNSLGDEDCDGIACSELIWSQIHGDQSDQAITGMVVDAQGNLIVAGYFNGSLKFGTTTLASSGSNDYFLVKLSPSGDVIWAKKFGSATDNGSLVRVAVDKSGNIAMAGQFAGTFDFGGSVLIGQGFYDIFVASFDPDGKHRWSKRFGDSLGQYATSIAIDSNSNIVVAGSLQGTVNFGNMDLTGNDSGDIFLVKLTADGVHLWSKRFGDASGQMSDIQGVSSVGIDVSDNIIVTGSFGISIDFGPVTLTASGIGSDMFLAKFDALGNYSWSKRFGGTANDIGDAVTTDSSGNILLTGRMSGNVDFGGGNLTTNGPQDMFVAKFSSAGVHQWSKNYGATSYETGSAIATDASDNVIVAGTFKTSIDFGGGSFTNVGAGTTDDLYLVKFDASGAHLWSRAFGDSKSQYPGGLAIDPTSQSIVLGAVSDGTVDFGGGALTTAGGLDILLAKFQP